MNWLINYSKEQVDAINDFEELIDVVSNPSSNPSSNPISDPKIATYTTNRKLTQKLLISRFVPKINPAAIRPVDKMFPEDPPQI